MTRRVLVRLFRVLLIAAVAGLLTAASCSGSSQRRRTPVGVHRVKTERPRKAKRTSRGTQRSRPRHQRHAHPHAHPHPHPHRDDSHHHHPHPHPHLDGSDGHHHPY